MGLSLGREEEKAYIRGFNYMCFLLERKKQIRQDVYT